MVTKTVKFQSVNDMLDFVNKLENYPNHVEVESGQYNVSAKCLFGLVNLGLNKEIELKVYDGECEKLFKDIEPYIAA